MDIKFKPITGGFFAHHRKEADTTKADLHYHDSYELYYLLDGERNYLTQSKIYPLNPDWVTLTRPYIIHGTNGESYERFLISFSEDFLTTYFQPPLIEIFHEVFAIEAIPAQIISQYPQIKELFSSIVDNFRRDNVKNAALELGLLLIKIYDLIKRSPPTSESVLPSQMQAVLAYVSNNMATVKTLEQVANHFYVSKYHLSHQFKNSTGFTFVEFLTKVRLSRALHLLEHTNDTIASISETCGFETPTYFGVVFKKKMHMTPLQYRNWIAKKKSPTKT